MGLESYSDELHFEILPNPGREQFTVRLNEKTAGFFEVHSASGIKNLEGRSNEEKEVSLDLRAFESGINLIRLINSDGRSQLKKLIKLKD